MSFGVVCVAPLVGLGVVCFSPLLGLVVRLALTATIACPFDTFNRHNNTMPATRSALVITTLLTRVLPEAHPRHNLDFRVVLHVPLMCLQSVAVSRGKVRLLAGPLSVGVSWPSVTKSSVSKPDNA